MANLDDIVKVAKVTQFEGNPPGARSLDVPTP
jgi:hypothetical protein